jgi:septal ring factor EnvC (AmiA/AmiB activator)
MRAPAVLLNVVMAGFLGGVVGYNVANRTSREEISRLQQTLDLTRIREHELQNQLQAAETERATLAAESQRLQTNLTERLRRLEEIAAQLAAPTEQTPPPPPVLQEEEPPQEVPPRE